jgi:hypothetical protein
MHIVQIYTDYEHAERYTEVSLTPVANIETAQKALVSLVRKAFKKYDITVNPVVDDKVYRSIENDDETVDCSTDDHYCISTLKKPSATKPVAELVIEENALTIEWYLVK